MAAPCYGIWGLASLDWILAASDFVIWCEGIVVEILGDALQLEKSEAAAQIAVCICLQVAELPQRVVTRWHPTGHQVVGPEAVVETLTARRILDGLPFSSLPSERVSFLGSTLRPGFDRAKAGVVKGQARIDDRCNNKGGKKQYRV
ncbi:hypothetical protein L249_3095 [Ophiocordyceps polyrhachis-furcata BCC 54312]|uniref:AMP-binding enzyme C-terminal domain-containing protein n=1 Tax=Ophiocordyceps polyrhachis-furcata BCC 54312 TaxID=1330021 RepID=A0A367LRI5_9HYPO|nr:hypothetical protein L249_3095 [Ophiocordyceps polyrhachis-furcata BCC 54312]